MNCGLSQMPLQTRHGGVQHRQAIFREVQYFRIFHPNGKAKQKFAISIKKKLTEYFCDETQQTSIYK